MNPVVMSVIACAGTALLNDLIGFERAKAQWKREWGNSDLVDEPTFDWTLCATRVVIGAVSGLLTGLGINQAIGGSS